jgi:hypothetical protein
LNLLVLVLLPVRWVPPPGQLLQLEGLLLQQLGTLQCKSYPALLKCLLRQHLWLLVSWVHRWQMGALGLSLVQQQRQP